MTISPGTANMRAGAARRACRAPTATHPTRIIRRARRRAFSATTAWTTTEMALVLKRVPIGWNQDDFDVLENGNIVGRIFFLDAVGPQGGPWMWASGHNGDIRRAAYGYEPTREAAMAAFAKSWRRV